MKITRLSLPLALAMAAAFSASPAMAQGNGHGNGNNRHRAEARQEHRDRDHDDDRYENEDDDHRRTRQQPRFERRRNVPAGWCQGRGNPHNTVENCGYGNDRYDSRSRTTNRTTSRSTTGSRGSYDQAHRDFHYTHDRQCRERAAQRPLDVRWQIQVRSECKATHDEFHRRWGVAHR